MALLDVSAAFDSVDHEILVNRLRISFGITGRALDWLNSVYSRTNTVSRHRGPPRGLTGGAFEQEFRRVPYVLGPLLYVLFTSDVPRILAELNLGVQQYADESSAYCWTPRFNSASILGTSDVNSTYRTGDDTQGYVHGRAENAADSMGLLQDAILKIESWMSSNHLKLNQNKTQYIWIGTQFQLAKINKQQLARMFPGVNFLESVVDLGVVIEGAQNGSAHR